MMTAEAIHRDRNKINIYGAGRTLVGHYYRDDQHLDFKQGVTRKEAEEAFAAAEAVK